MTPSRLGVPAVRARRHLRRLAGALVCTALLAPPAPGRAQFPERYRTEAMARRAKERIEALRREAEALAAHERTILGELRAHEVERDLKTEELATIDGDLDTIAREMADTEDRIERLDRTVGRERPGLEARLVEIYKLGRGGYLRLWLGVRDPRSLGRSLRLASALARLDRQRTVEYRQNLDALRASHQAIAQRRARMATLRDEATEARAAAQRAADARARLVQHIDERRDLTATLVGELEAAHQKLQQTLATLSPAAGGAPSGGAPVVLPLRPFRGELDWPILGRVLRRFGRGHPNRATTALMNGIQITAREGSAVRAVHDGTVAFADPFAGFGTLVVLDHGNDAHSLYGYLATAAVRRGTHVDRGQVVGTVGLAPADGPALYFELRVDRVPVDPIEWLKRR